MAEKIIKISLEANGDICFYNNSEIKKTIANDCNEILGEDILKILDVDYEDVFKLEPIQEEDKNPRYKVYKMIYELIKDVIDNLLTSEKDHIFDVSASEIPLIKEDGENAYEES